MNGFQIERVLDLIDANLDITKREFLAYLVDHQEEVLSALRERGEAVIPTSAGVIILPLSALAEPVAA